MQKLFLEIATLLMKASTYTPTTLGEKYQIVKRALVDNGPLGLGFDLIGHSRVESALDGTTMDQTITCLGEVADQEHLKLLLRESDGLVVLTHYRRSSKRRERKIGEIIFPMFQYQTTEYVADVVDQRNDVIRSQAIARNRAKPAKQRKETVQKKLKEGREINPATGRARKIPSYDGGKTVSQTYQDNQNLIG